MHDRYLQASNSQSTIRIREIQYYHHSCAAALFKRRLSRLDDYPPHDRNAIWTAGAMLSNMSAFIPKPDRPEETWPLATDSDSNLNWLHFSRALPTLYRLALPFDASSMFFDLYHDEEHKTLVRKWEEDGREGTEGIPPSFIHLFSLMPSSNAENNPYHAAVRSLLQIWDMPATRCNAFRFLSFISLLRPEMRDLLVRKDPRALLLLAYWYTKMFDIHWWFQNRAVAECSAICIYLQKNEFSNSLLMKMVQYPLSMVAALQSGKEVDC